MPETRKIIRNVYIVSCDDANSGGIGTVTIRDDRITSVSYGRSREDNPAPDVEVIDGTGKILLPGFIDLHVHGESLILDLHTSGEPQSRWHRREEYAKAETYWYQHATKDEWRRLYTTVCFQALRSGVTFLGEFGIPGGDQACTAALEAFRRTELPGMLSLHNGDQIELARSAKGTSTIFNIALPPAEELTTYNLQATLRLSRESGYPMLLHMSDAEKDLDLLIKNFGKGPLQILDEYGMLDSGCLLVHMHVQEPKDVERLSLHEAVPILSPGAAIRKGLPFPPVSVYRQEQIRSAMCTDWGPFTHWKVLRELIERESMAKNQAPSALAFLRDLTIYPAAAIGMSREIGSIVPGKRADLQMIKCRGLDLLAALDVLSPADLAQAMVQRVSTSDVSDVMVRGEFSIREGTVLTYSEEDIVQDIRDLLVAPTVPNEQKTVTENDLPVTPHEEDEVPEIGEEGFRIVRRTEDGPPTATILPLDPGREPKKDLPKTVRRIFGEDDL